MSRIFFFLRGLFVALVLEGAYTIFFSLPVIIRGYVFGQPDEGYRMIKDYWARPILWCGNVEVEYRKSDKLPKGGCLFLFNHTSYTDILAVLVGLPDPPKFGAKAELFKIPFFGFGMSAVKLLKIHRHDRKRVLQIYKESKQRVQNGENFALAPEGTRQTNDDLGRFKKGPFIFAMSAEMFIVPLVIAGARQVQPKGSYLMNLKKKKSKIIIQSLDPIDATQYTEETLSELQEAVRTPMLECYSKLKAELGISESSPI